MATVESKNQELSIKLERLKVESEKGGDAREELTRKSEALSGVEEKLRQYKAENRDLEAQAQELSAALEKAKARNTQLEERLAILCLSGVV